MSGAVPVDATLERAVTVGSELGFHMRPMQKFIEICGTFRAEVRVRRAEGIDGTGPVEVDGRSIFGLMELAATRGTSLTLLAEGDDATDTLAALADFFARNFDE